MFCSAASQPRKRDIKGEESLIFQRKIKLSSPLKIPRQVAAGDEAEC